MFCNSNCLPWLYVRINHDIYRSHDSTYTCMRVLCELVLTVQILRKQHSSGERRHRKNDRQQSPEPVTYTPTRSFSHTSYGIVHAPSSHIATYVPVTGVPNPWPLKTPRPWGWSFFLCRLSPELCCFLRVWTALIHACNVPNYKVMTCKKYLSDLSHNYGIYIDRCWLVSCGWPYFSLLYQLTNGGCMRVCQGDYLLTHTYYLSSKKFSIGSGVMWGHPIAMSLLEDYNSYTCFMKSCSIYKLACVLYAIQ